MIDCGASLMGSDLRGNFSSQYCSRDLYVWSLRQDRYFPTTAAEPFLHCIHSYTMRASREMDLTIAPLKQCSKKRN